MTTRRVLTPREFAEALVAVVPATLEAKLKEVYFDLATQLHEAVVLNCAPHIDTGYMRAGFQATPSAQAPEGLPPRNPKAHYDPVFDEQSKTSIGTTTAALGGLTMGFVADYAPYVEDRFHIVAQARGEFPLMVERAVRNASEDGA